MRGDHGEQSLRDRLRVEPGKPVDVAAWDARATPLAPGGKSATGDTLAFVPDPAGHPARVVTRIDGDAFAETWLTAVEAAAC